MKAKLFFLILITLILLDACNNRTNEYFIPTIKGIFTSVHQQMPTIKTPDGPVIGNGDVGIVFGGNPEDQYFYLSKNDIWKAKNGYPDGGVFYIGTLKIKSDVLKNAPYYAGQQIGTARITTCFEQNEYQYAMTSWIAATENVAVIEKIYNLFHMFVKTKNFI